MGEIIEKWKPVFGHPGYQVSNLGRVKSLRKKKWGGSPRGYHFSKDKILRPGLNKKNGYLYVVLYSNNEKKTVTVHRIACEAFHKNPRNLPCTNHKNGIKSDNRIENLEWCDKSYNGVHANKMGLLNIKKGIESWSAKLTEKQVQGIRKSKLPNKALAKKFKVCSSHISRIKNKQKWKHLK